MSEDASPGSASPTRTPLFEAHHASRYHRQDLIKRYEDLTDRRLIVYYANIATPNSSITAVDIAPFHDLLMECGKNSKIDLMLQSPGGDIETAEKVVHMIRLRADEFRVIVPDRAKSAATMMSLAADEIIMSGTSELGPIDPQVSLPNANGQLMQRPARSFLDGLEDIKKVIAKEGGINPAYYPLLQQLDPALLDYCEKAVKRSRQFAVKWLKLHMLKNDPDCDNKAQSIADKLVNVQQYTSHGMVIDHEEAGNLGLNVTYLEPDDKQWEVIWSLFVAYQVECLQRNYTKVYEGRKVSVIY